MDDVVLYHPVDQPDRERSEAMAAIPTSLQQLPRSLSKAWVEWFRPPAEDVE